MTSCAVCKGAGFHKLRKKIACDPPCAAKVELKNAYQQGWGAAKIDSRAIRFTLVRRAYVDGLEYAAQLIREYEIEHNKLYRERLTKHIEGKIKT